MLRELLAFEFKLQSRQIGFWVTLAIMLLVGTLASSVDWLTIGASGGERVKINGSFTVANFVGTISVLSIFFAAVFTVTGILRDDTHKALEIVHATPVMTRDMILSRMIVVWLTTCVCAGAAVLGYMFGQFMPWAPEDSYGPFNLLYYLHPFVLFIMVNALLITAIYTAVAVITRNRAIVYVSAVGLLIVSSAIDAVLTAQAPDWARSLLEPFGGGAFNVVTEFWSAAERNTKMVALNSWFGANRLFATLLALGIFAAGYIMSRRGIVTRRGKARKTDDVPMGAAPRRVDPVTPRLGFGHSLLAFWRRVRFEYVSTIRTTAMVILLSLAAVIFVFNLLLGDQFNPNPTLQTSSALVNLALGSLGLTMVIVMVFFGSDIIWRDRLAGFHKIMDATPVSNVSLLLAKWGALALLLLSIVAAGLLMAAGAHLITGETSVVPRTYIALGLLNFFIVFFFQGMLVMFIQSFVPGRIIGMFVAAGILIGVLIVLPQTPFYHPVMSFGSASPGAFSEMAGFQGFKSFWFELAYWGFAVVVLAMVSLWMWRRGLQVGLLDRLRALPRRVNLASGAVAALALAGFVSFAVMNYRAFEANDYMNSAEREERTANFEKLVIDSFDRPTPRITKVSVDVDFHPAKRTGLFNGTMVIDNPHDVAIERAFVTTRVPVERAEIEIEGATRVTGEELADELWEEYEVADYAFTPPLQPGESRTVRFTTRYVEPTIASGSAVRTNGTFINNAAAMPIFGNLNGNFLTNPDKRKKFDLPERERWPERDDEDARRYQLLTSFAGYSDYVDFDARVCTDPDQVPVAPGKFVRAFSKDGQHCREYRAINPIHHFYSFVSARYEVRTEKWTGANGQTVDLEIYFHPEHDYNIDLMFRAMRQSFDTFTETFSDYQYAQLRIMEFPYGSFAQAFAGTVPFSENIGFVQDPGSADDPTKVDFATYVTMHEIGHMWFAHQVVGAFAQGSNLLSEGLTENATMLAYEDLYGFEKARRMHEVRATQRYLTDRAFERDREPVLAEAEDQGYLNYNKTSWVMWGLRGYLGDDVVQPAVRRFLTEYAATKGAPYPTTLELIEIFKEDFPEEYHGLVDDYWNRITFWDMKVDGDIEVVPVGERFEVRVPVTMKKTYADPEDGKETDVTELDDAELNEFLQVGFYSEDPKDDLGANPSALETVRVTQTDQVLTFTVDARPTHVVLDPKRLLIERNVGDNVAKVDVTAESSATGN